jgi:energy-coupling factor transporter ATP-binding protein EcfA2
VKAVIRTLCQSAIQNCGLPYRTSGQGSASEDQQHVINLEGFLGEYQHQLVLMDPGGDEEDIQYNFLFQGDDPTALSKDLINKWAGGGVNEDVLETLCITRTADASEYKLFRLLSNILALEKHEQKKAEKTRERCTKMAKLPEGQELTATILHIFACVDALFRWKSLSTADRQISRSLWTRKYAEAREFDPPKSTDLEGGGNVPEPVGEFMRTIFTILRKWDDIVRNPEFGGSCSKLLDTNMRLLEQMVAQYDSTLLSYTLTWHSVVRILRLLYRIYSNVPVILMGETGSGKSYTIKFLSGIAGPNVEQIRKVIDGGTTEADLRDFIRKKLEEHKNERVRTMEQVCIEMATDQQTPSFVKKFFLGLDPKNLSAPQVDAAVEAFVHRFLSNPNDFKDCKLQDEVVKSEGFRRHLKFQVDRLFTKVDQLQKHVLFFFDEVNTAPCQWFLKEVMIDRYFDGAILPADVSFICAVNPYRKLSPALKTKFSHIQAAGKDQDLADLVYKVHQMPESFKPFILPADPNRGPPVHPVKDLSDVEKRALEKPDVDSEFDEAIREMVSRGLTRGVGKFHPPTELSLGEGRYLRSDGCEMRAGEIFGDRNPFWLSDRFTISFDYEFFQTASPGAKPTDVDNWFQSFCKLVWLLCLRSCRFLGREIYRDDSFTSVREAEVLTQLLRYLFRLGLHEPLDLSRLKERAYVEHRLRRSLLMALIATFWSRLGVHEDAQQGGSNRSFNDRQLYLNAICKFGGNLKPVNGVEPLKAPYLPLKCLHN